MEIPNGKSTRKKHNVLSLIRFVSLDQIPKIKICHMVASEHRKVIELRRRFLDTDVIDYEEVYEDASIDNGCADLYEEVESGPGEGCVIAVVPQSGIEEVKEIKQGKTKEAKEM